MPNYDEFDDPDQEGTISRMLNLFRGREPVGARTPFFALAVVGGLAVLLGAVLYISYPRGGDGRGDQAVPIIRADAGPVKTEPESQGGMEIPNRESTVFNSMRGQPADGKVESLLPQTEQPVDRSQVFASAGAPAAEEARDKPADLTESASQMASAAPASGQPVETQETAQGVAASVPVSEPVSEHAAPPATPPVAAAAVPAPVSAPAKAPEKTVVASVAPVKAAAEKPASSAVPPHAVPPHAAPAGGGAYAQLAALTDKAAAAAAWKNLQKQYPQLAGQAYRVESATVKGRAFYRLQAGPLSADKAKAVCKTVNAKKPGGCLVVGG